MKQLCVVFLFLILVLPSLSHGEEINAGFVQGIWFSSEKVFANNPIRIYVALRNNTEHDLTGIVYFSDNGTRIGSSNVSALSGRLVEAWVDWKPAHGDHKLSASLHNAELHPIGAGTRDADAMSTLAELTLFVDYDTDADNVGNTADEDDDNDGVSDLEEKVRGSNPLVQNPKVTDVNTNDATSTAQSESSTTPIQSPEITPEETTREGLEKYLNGGVADSLLQNVTNKVENAKQSLDTYREERNAESVTPPAPEATATMTPLGTYSGNATITRSKIESDGSFMSSFVDGVASLLHSIWTFVLWILSKGLSHPALIQIVLLLGILYIFFKIARRIGRRPNN